MGSVLVCCGLSAGRGPSRASRGCRPPPVVPVACTSSSPPPRGRSSRSPAPDRCRSRDAWQSPGSTTPSAPRSA
uniref:Putative secreted protein n=1 Tax=Anopheles marajoara TaxID=58244 RepID=A0A2M4CDF5_9DIPT